MWLSATGISHRGEINHCFILLSKMHMHSKMMTICRMCGAWFRKSLKMSHDTEATSSKRKLRKYGSAIDTSCAFETNDLNLTTANFDSYGNVSFDPCEFTLHTVANAENNDCSNKLVCFLQHMNMGEKNGDHSTSVNVDLFQSCFQI